MLIQINNITKKFGGLTALNNVNLNIKKSEILGLIGPNGAGKSTLINVICGFHKPTGGSIIFDGNDITDLKAHEITPLGIGRIFQLSNLFMDLSVKDNVFSAFHLGYKLSMWKQVLRLPSALKEEHRLRNASIEILNYMGLGGLKDEPASNLPHGHQRTLSICMALATNPKLLLLDEPVTGMNQTEIQAMMGIIKQVRDRGISILLVEHNMDAVMSLCDRIVVLDQGQKIAEGLPKEIQANTQVIEAYLGKC